MKHFWVLVLLINVVSSQDCVSIGACDYNQDPTSFTPVAVTDGCSVYSAGINKIITGPHSGDKCCGLNPVNNNIECRNLNTQELNFDLVSLRLDTLTQLIQDVPEQTILARSKIAAKRLLSKLSASLNPEKKTDGGQLAGVDIKTQNCYNVLSSLEPLEADLIIQMTLAKVQGRIETNDDRSWFIRHFAQMLFVVDASCSTTAVAMNQASKDAKMSWTTLKMFTDGRMKENILTIYRRLSTVSPRYEEACVLRGMKAHQAQRKGKSDSRKNHAEKFNAVMTGLKFTGAIVGGVFPGVGVGVAAVLGMAHSMVSSVLESNADRAELRDSMIDSWVETLTRQKEILDKLREIESENPQAMGSVSTGALSNDHYTRLMRILRLSFVKAMSIYFGHTQQSINSQIGSSWEQFYTESSGSLGSKLDDLSSINNGQVYSSIVNNCCEGRFCGRASVILDSKFEGKKMKTDVDFKDPIEKVQQAIINPKLTKD